MADEWKDSLPDYVKEWDETKNSDTKEKFFEQLANHRKSLGQSIRIPGEDASDEVVKAFQDKLIGKVPGLIQSLGDDPTDEDYERFYKSIGQPEELDGYVYDTDEDLTTLRETALNANLTKAQFKRMAKKTLETAATKTADSKSKHEEAITGLKTKWGEAYAERRELAEQVRTQYFPHMPEGDKVGATTIEALASIGKQLDGKESSNINSATGDTKSGVMTPDEAKMRISEIMSNKDHAYWNPRDLSHMAARRKMTDLNKFAYPG